MTVTQPIWYYESQICFILYGAVDRLDKESLACASRLLERMATDRPSYDRQLMKLYSVCCQYNKNPERFESSVTFRGYRSLCWWRNIQYRNHLWNELQELTTPIQLAQKAFLAPKGRMDIDPQYIWRGYRFFKNGVSDQEYARKYSRTPSYDRMFENITLSGYHSDSGISIAETEAFRRGMLVILAIHQYQVEQGKIPESVATLVQAGYLKEIPNGPGYNQPIGLTKKLAQPFISRPVRNGMETIPPSGNVPDEIVQKPKEIKLYWHIADYTDPLWWNIQKFYYAQIYWNNFHLVLPDLSPEANKVQFEFESAQQGKNGYFSVPCVLVPTIGGTNSAIVYALPWRNRSDQ